MSFFEQLSLETETERQQLLATPILQRAVLGDIQLIEYVNFLTEAYHHVKHTTPLLMSAGSRIPGNKEWVRNALAEYVEEELGHQEWILNDMDYLITDYLSEESINNRGIFNYKKVLELIEDNRNGTIDASYPIWSLLAIESWMRQFND